MPKGSSSPASLTSVLTLPRPRRRRGCSRSGGRPSNRLDFTGCLFFYERSLPSISPERRSTTPLPLPLRPRPGECRGSSRVSSGTKNPTMLGHATGSLDSPAESESEALRGTCGGKVGEPPYSHPRPRRPVSTETTPLTPRLRPPPTEK